MQKILLIGKSSHENFGDIYMAAQAARWVSECGFEPILLQSSSRFFEQVRVLEPSCQWTDFKSISDKTIGGIFYGGGYFGHSLIGARNWCKKWLKENYFYKSYKSLVERDLPFILLSVEIGPIISNSVKSKVSKIIKKSSFSIARNGKSALYGSRLTGTKVKNGGDIIFNEFKSDNCKKSILGLKNNKKRVLLIHVTDKNNNKDFRKVAYNKALKNAVKKEKIDKIIFASDSKGQDESFLVMKNIFKVTKNKELEYRPFVDCKSVFEAVEESTHVITTKLHLGVLALAKGKEVLCFSDHPKVKRFYNDLNLKKRLKTFNFSFSFQKVRHIKEFLLNQTSMKFRDFGNCDYEKEVKAWLKEIL